MPTLPVLLSLLSVVLLTTPVRGAIILNTLDDGRPRDPGLSGGINGMFSGEGGNTEEINFELGSYLQWDGEGQRLRFHLNGEYTETAGVETEREVVAHLRHIKRLGGPWSSVIFGQIQHNPFQHLKRRWLLGVGPRLDLIRDDHGLVAVGATPMLEIELVDDADDPLTRGRMSVFLQLIRRLSENTRLNGTVFYQPLFSDVSAARAAGTLALGIDLSGSLEMQTGVEVEYNAEPPEGVEKTDWSTFLGLGYKF